MTYVFSRCRFVQRLLTVEVISRSPEATNTRYRWIFTKDSAISMPAFGKLVWLAGSGFR